MSKTIAIITAGGTGKRMKSTIYKQFMEIEGIPILALTLKHFEQADFIDGIIVTSPAESLIQTAEEVIDRYHISKVLKIVEGGSMRQHSVYNAIRALPKDTGYVFIHDGVRPFLSGDFLESLYKSVQENKAVIPGIKPVETLKAIDNHQVKETINRDKTILVQTPQVFEAELLISAYNRVDLINQTFTDDAAIVETAGTAELIWIEGLPYNLKITTPEDLEIAHFLYDKYLKKELI
ncbi:MAG: 2-C-methyl-D-erythritol 4-phosphate cytidylyltransferase [Calditrichia bacterium]